MTDEEFERLKAAEKEHLRAKKKLQATLQQLRRKKQVRSAVDRLARSAQSALDRASDLIGQLTSETARDEARMEMALDDAARDADAPPDADVEAFEAARRTEQARDLVRQMKQAQRIPHEATTDADPAAQDGAAQDGAAQDGAADSAPEAPPASDATSSADGLSTSSPDDLPEKTIGRMR